MNDKAQQYWDEFWSGKEAPTSVTAEQFGYGDLIDELAHLIVAGKKKATCSAFIHYDLEGAEIPSAGAYTIILDSKENPVAIIKTTEVFLIKMNEVTQELAQEEGEGDLSLKHWYDGHKKFFIDELAEYGMEFSEDMLLVFERFELVNTKETS